MDRKPTQSEVTAEGRTATVGADSPRHDSFRSEAGDSYANWNSWGERNPLSMGSFGRW